MTAKRRETLAASYFQVTAQREETQAVWRSHQVAETEMRVWEGQGG